MPVCSRSGQKKCVCCIFSGTAQGCQGAAKCAGSPPNTSNICKTRKPFITLENMKDIKAAVQGMTVRADGAVDHSSTALTPHLTLGIVWYDFELDGSYEWVKEDGLLNVIDVVSAADGGL